MLRIRISDPSLNHDPTLISVTEIFRISFFLFLTLTLILDLKSTSTTYSSINTIGRSNISQKTKNLFFLVLQRFLGLSASAALFGTKAYRYRNDRPRPDP
jgi:hypothetical protein